MMTRTGSGYFPSFQCSECGRILSIQRRVIVGGIYLCDDCLKKQVKEKLEECDHCFCMFNPIFPPSVTCCRCGEKRNVILKKPKGKLNESKIYDLPNDI
jgi:hypothetical protein